MSFSLAEKEVTATIYMKEPYFDHVVNKSLQNNVYSVLSTGACLLSFWLAETLHPSNSKYLILLNIHLSHFISAAVSFLNPQDGYYFNHIQLYFNSTLFV